MSFIFKSIKSKVFWEMAQVMANLRVQLPVGSGSNHGSQQLPVWHGRGRGQHREQYRGRGYVHPQNYVYTNARQSIVSIS